MWYVYSFPHFLMKKTNKTIGWLGPPLPVGRCMDRSHHPVGQETTSKRVHGMDRGEVEGVESLTRLTFDIFSFCLNTKHPHHHQGDRYTLPGDGVQVLSPV
jgi:hypothetical protein